MSVLVLEGHATRTEDLLAVLKSLGSLGGLSRVYPQYYYYVSNGKIMVTSGLIQGEWALFTLEKFEEKYPYKAGDKVMYKRELHFVKGMEWNGEEIRYKIDCGDGYSLTSIKVEELEPYKVKEETMEKNEHLILDCVSTDKGHELVPHDDYEIKQEGDKYYLVKKKPKYPNTYIECCEVLGINELPYIAYTWNRNEDVEVILQEYQISLLEKLEHFRKLLICRDAYWKIAGDWKPGLKSYCDNRGARPLVITYDAGIIKYCYTDLNEHRILMFPTDEMRDAFYENFKELIESCKELL